MPTEIITVAWHDGAVRLIDQTRLPAELVTIDCTDLDTLCEAILKLRVRGAPALGVSAAYGLAMVAHHSQATDVPALQAELREASKIIGRTRPTAVNLFWALQRLGRLVEAGAASAAGMRATLLAAAQQVEAEDRAANEALSKLGAELLPERARVVTHCNAGALCASGGYGTALGVIRAAAEAGKVAMVYADETRPLLQGARLTAWEMVQLGVPVTVLTDSMAASLMASGQVNCVVTGADRIAANGDVANKIGTYGLAIVAKHHGVPFYVAAPTSTLDLNLASGADIPIEQRSPDEVRGFRTEVTAPAEAEVYNPAFDVTPHELVAAIVTERGVARDPYVPALQAMVSD